MHVIRVILLCWASLSVAMVPSRAAAVCSLAVSMHAAAIGTSDPALSRDAERHGARHECPDVMACCAPAAIQLAAPMLAAPRAWRALLRAPPTAERPRDDAARPRLLRPPMSA